jgi:hypothetical protein
MKKVILAFFIQSLALANSDYFSRSETIKNVSDIGVSAEFISDHLIQKKSIDDYLFVEHVNSFKKNVDLLVTRAPNLLAGHEKYCELRRYIEAIAKHKKVNLLDHYTNTYRRLVFLSSKCPN